MKALKSKRASELLADPNAREQLRLHLMNKHSGANGAQTPTIVLRSNAFQFPLSSGAVVLPVDRRRLRRRCRARFHRRVGDRECVRKGLPVHRHTGRVFVDAEGKLDRVVLQEVMRRPIAADKNAPEPETDEATKGEATPRFYPIDGDYFVLRYSEAITLNVEYVKLIESDGKPEIAAEL